MPACVKLGLAQLDAGTGCSREKKREASLRRRRRRTGGGPAGRQAGRRQILKQLWSPPNLPFSLCCNKCSMQQPISLFRYFQALVSPSAARNSQSLSLDISKRLYPPSAARNSQSLSLDISKLLYPPSAARNSQSLSLDISKLLYPPSATHMCCC